MPEPLNGVLDRIPICRVRAACTALAVLLFSLPAYAVRVAVEVSDEVEPLVDARLVRRLIRLELADVELPKVNGGAPAQAASSADGKAPSSSPTGEEVVFVRLLRNADVLTVELWALGELSGERHLSLSANQQHQARRVALASAELARRLREARVVERQRVLRQHLAPLEHDQVPAYLTKVNVEGTAGLSAVWWTGAQTTLVGPRFGIGATTQSGWGLGLGVQFLTAAAPSAARSWTELALRPSWQFGIGSAATVALTGQLGAGLVDIGPNYEFAGSETSRQTWATKVAVEPQLNWLLGSRLALCVAPEAGWVTRRLHLDAPAGALKLGGAWFGLTVGARLVL